jgi:hypothetical protein
MKYKKIMLVTFLLLAILTVSAVSASEDMAMSDDGEELSQSLDDALTVEDAQEDLAEDPSGESIAGGDADDVLSYEASDFNVEINESMDLRYEDAAAITFDAPDGAYGEILVGVNKTDERYVFNLDDSPITLDDLWIEKTGTYSIYVYFSYTDDGEIYHEINLLNGTINVSQTIMTEDFDFDYLESDAYDPIDDLSYDVFDLYDSPADGNLIIFVDNRKVYNLTVHVTDFDDDYIGITSEDLEIDGEDSPYHIAVIFNTTEGEEFTLADFNAYYDISNSQEPYISIYSMIIKEQIAPLAYISDDNSVNGTVTVSIDGKKYYEKQFDGTRDYLFIHHYDLDGLDVFDKDFLGNHTVKVTYNNFTKESTVTFVFEPYFTIPYNVPAGEVSYIVFNAPGNFTGNVILYNAVYNEEDDRAEIGSLISSYAISSSASEVPLPALTPGVHLFYMNYTIYDYNIYTIDGKSDAGFFGVEAIENSQNFTSSISSTKIIEGTPVTVTVTGPKEGWFDFYVDMEHVAVYSLVNGTVEHTFSDLTKGTHVISVSYDGEGYNDLFYAKEFLVVVTQSSSGKIIDVSVDSSDTRIYGELILTDIATGEVFKRNITSDLIKSSMTNPGNYSSNATEIMNQLLSLAQAQAGDKQITVKTQNVSAKANSRYDNRIYTWIDIGEWSYLEVGGDYGTKWIVNVTVIAEYASETINISNVKVVLSKNTFTYNAKVQKPTVTLTNGAVLKEGVDYTLQWSTASPKNAGTYTVTVTGIGAYTGTAKVTFKINKAANPLKVKAKTAKVKFSKLKKKAQKLKVTKVVKFTKKGQGTLTYKKVKGNKKISINKKTGKVTIKKGLKKGTYKVKVKIKAKGNANYKASAFKTVTFKIKVK